MRPGTLSTRRDFDRVIGAGRRATCGGLTAFAMRGPGDGSRLGLIVRGPGAVARNRTKRRLREAFARCRVAGRDVVLRTDSGVNGLDFQELVDRLQRLMAKAGSE